MSNLVRRQDVLDIVQEWTYCSDVEDLVRALPAVQPDLTDPNVVHANMLRGTIARPTVDQIRHIYGSELTALHALAPDWPTQIDDILSNFAGRQRRLGAEFERALAEDIEKLYEGGPAQPRVKPLVWQPGIVDWAKPLPGMKYVACSTTPEGYWAWWLDGTDVRSVEPDEEAAKAAAQADYEARILSALDNNTGKETK